MVVCSAGMWAVLMDAWRAFLWAAWKAALRDDPWAVSTAYRWADQRDSSLAVPKAADSVVKWAVL